MLIKPYLSEKAVILVDDSNYRHVRLANRDFIINNPEFKLIFESYTPCHPDNMNATELVDAKSGWWNGINVIVKDNKNNLAPMYPPTFRIRKLFENEHITQTSKYPEKPLWLDLFYAALSRLRILRAFYYLSKALFYRKGQLKGKYNVSNTYSSNLPVSNYNE